MVKKFAVILALSLIGTIVFSILAKSVNSLFQIGAYICGGVFICAFAIGLNTYE